MIENNKEIIDTAYQAMEEIGIRPLITPIRGGTDGARLSYMGLPTPNIFTGGHNFHGKYEFIPVFAMEKAVELIVKIAELYGQKGR
ncbi:MAG: M20/M25/M40 family metallo-hydrolase [Halanaerobiales bacterium]